MSRAQLTSTVEQSSGGVVAPFLAGKNKIINGDFGINQRNFTTNTASATYMFDRWKSDNSGGTVTFSAQTFTPGTAPVAGYESTNYLQCVVSGQSGTNYAAVLHRIEDIRTFAGQTITLSFWAKASSGTPSVLPTFAQQAGSGGSGQPAQTNLAAKAISTSWVRYSWTTTLPSLTGTTIGTGSSLQLEINFSDGGGNATGLGIQNNTFSIWGVQLEAGSVATPFTTCSNTLQGELALCQRYYWRGNANGDGSYPSFGTGSALSTTQIEAFIPFPVAMRSAPTVIDYSTLGVWDSVTITALNAAPSIPSGGVSKTGARVYGPTAGGLTQYRPYQLIVNNSTSGYIGFSAEL